MRDRPLIYCIDDSPDDLSYLEELLKNQYDTKCFSSAKSALLSLDSEEPDIIICDLIMPDIDGFQFAKNYNELYSHRDTIIIFLSSIDDPDKISEMLNYGAYDYLVKPVSEKVLISKIEKAFIYLKEKKNQKIVIDLARADKEKIIKLVSNELFNTKLILVENDNYQVFNVYEGQMDQTLNEKILYSQGRLIITQSPSNVEKLYKKDTTQSIKCKGFLSKINIKNKIITIQTEVANYPFPHIQSIADLGGRVIDKLVFKIENSFDENTISNKIQELHLSLENKIKEKINSMISTENKEKKDFKSLVEEGFELYREGKLEEALYRWLEAKKLKPDDKILEVNIDVLQKKIEKLKTN